MTVPKKGDELVMITDKGRKWRCLYYGKDKEDPRGWILVIFPHTRHMARVNPRWVKFVRRR